MNLIDTNAWSGCWPFGPVSKQCKKLPILIGTGYRIQQAMVSSLESIYQSDPMPGNRDVFTSTYGRRSYRPLPIINPATPAWEDHLIEVSEKSRVVAVRLLPQYHGYSLQSVTVKKLIRRLEDLQLRLIIVARLVDERQEHPAVNIKPIPVAQLKKFIENHPKVHPLIQGYGVHELKELAQAKGDFSTDTSFAEWEDTLRVINRNVPVSRIIFGSLSPLQITQAQVDKVRLSSLPKKQREAVGIRNCQSYFNI